jgi:hypothetical protein
VRRTLEHMAIAPQRALLCLAAAAAVGTGGAACTSSPSFTAPHGAVTAAASLPPAPDYATRKAWLSLPDAGATLGMVPKESGLSDLQSTAPVDVFYVYPTTAFAEDVIPFATGLNAAYDDALADGLAYEIGANQAAPFSGVARIYAPYYRQVFMDAWFATPNPAPVVAPAAEAAYGDVRRAFDYYLAHYNHGRPIVLAGHSQGSMIGYRLLEDEFDGKPLGRRLVAAYLPGQAIDANFYASFKTVHPCASATDLHCVVSWATFEDTVAAKSVRDFYQVSPYWSGGNTGYATPGPPLFPSANLLTWNTAAAKRPRGDDLGALEMKIPYPPLYYPHANPYPMGRIVAATFSAQTLGAGASPRTIGMYVAPHPPKSEFTAYVPGLFKPIYQVDFGGVWHLYDFNLFWMNVRQNARDRTNAYLSSAGDGRPLIAGPVAVKAKAGAPFSYQTETVWKAARFSATGLPSTLKIDPNDGLIAGTAPAPGSYAIVITATNAAGSASGELALVVT